MTLEMIIATLGWEKWKECVASWDDTATNSQPANIIWDRDILDAYQQGFKRATAEVLGYCHDDLMIYEAGWNERVMQEFEDPEVGLVGFGGAMGHGDPMMYRKPYEPSQLGRWGFRSNMVNAAQHGAKYDGVCDVAVLDGFAMFVRREVLEKAGGWPVNTKIGYFCYDYWLSCMTRRIGYRIRLVGVLCEHLGGKSTGLNRDLKPDYEGSHRYIYDEFKDVLPCRILG